MNGFEILLCVIIGLGLAAACGFRVFVPLFIISLASHAGWVQLGSGTTWMGSTPALVAFGVATTLEVGSYYIPWVDNLLDTVATPAATVAGMLAAASMLHGVDPLLQWSIAVIAGGGAAIATQASTVVVRTISSATTGGLGNSVVSTTEAGLATGLSALSLATVFVPILAIILAALLVAMAVLIARVVLRRRRHHDAPPPAVSA